MMPPGQPVLRCECCGLLRPCREHADGWLCVECSPYDYDRDGAGNALGSTATSPSDATRLHADGGKR